MDRQSLCVMYMCPLPRRPCLDWRNYKSLGKNIVCALTDQCKLQSRESTQIFHPLWAHASQDRFTNTSGNQGWNRLKKRTPLAGTRQQTMIKQCRESSQKRAETIRNIQSVGRRDWGKKHRGGGEEKALYKKYWEDKAQHNAKTLWINK